MAKMGEEDAVKMNSTFLLTMMEQMIFYFPIQELITIVVRVRGTPTEMMVLLTTGTLTY